MALDVEKQMTQTPADWVPGPGQGHWTYTHYAALPEDGHHYEVVDGVLYMSPSPGYLHQNTVFWLVYYLAPRVRIAGLGEVCLAPFDVELASDTIVQPDVMVVLNERLDIITPSRIKGAPDLVIEILSPATASYDRNAKQAAYARAGVREYWLVNPELRAIEILYLDGAAYRQVGSFRGEDALISQVVPTIAEIPVELFFV